MAVDLEGSIYRMDICYNKLAAKLQNPQRHDQAPSFLDEIEKRHVHNLQLVGSGVWVSGSHSCFRESCACV